DLRAPPPTQVAGEWSLTDLLTVDGHQRAVRAAQEEDRALVEPCRTRLGGFGFLGPGRDGTDALPHRDSRLSLVEPLPDAIAEPGDHQEHQHPHQGAG